ncbi:MAG: hypothetical protein Q9M37_09690 [Desulfonauticus sp.]|nr:hypothetical protein [Desulfonauticus sp.]
MVKPTTKRKKLVLFKKLETLYQQMEQAYQKHAQALGLSCRDCEDNCCTSYFHHHTYIEWSYFLYGLKQADPEVQDYIQKQAKQYYAQMQTSLAKNQIPNIMCPVNKDGLCILYPYRLMICRLHGVPNFLTLPNGKIKEFPGCFKAQSLCSSENKTLPLLNRTPFYQKLARLEMEFLGLKKHSLSRIKLTLAEMILHPCPI